MIPPAPPSREAEIAARLEDGYLVGHTVMTQTAFADLRYLLAQLQQARQERDDLQQKCTEAFDDAVVQAGVMLGLRVALQQALRERLEEP